MAHDDLVSFARTEVDTTAWSGTQCLCMLATQRSGSTKICRDITAIKGFGTADEHFYWVEVETQKTGARPGFEAFLARGCEGNFFSIKLMANQLASFGAWVTPVGLAQTVLDGPQPARRFRQLALEFLSAAQEARFVRLKRRDLFAQAYSRVRARLTDVYHISSGGNAILSPFADTAKSMTTPPDNLQILREMQNVLNEEQLIETALADTSVPTLDLVFEDTLLSERDYLHDVAAWIGLGGLDVSRNEAATKRIVTNNELAKAKARFLSEIGFFA